MPTCIVKADDGLWLAMLSGQLFRVHGTSATLVDNPLLKHVWKLGLGHESDDGDSNHDSSRD